MFKKYIGIGNTTLKIRDISAVGIHEQEDYLEISMSHGAPNQIIHFENYDLAFKAYHAIQDTLNVHYIF